MFGFYDVICIDTGGVVVIFNPPMSNHLSDVSRSILFKCLSRTYVSLFRSELLGDKQLQVTIDSMLECLSDYEETRRLDNNPVSFKEKERDFIATMCFCATKKFFMARGLRCRVYKENVRMEFHWREATDTKPSWITRVPTNEDSF